MIKVCAWCGAKYSTKSGRQKYCCKKCYGAAQREMANVRDFDRKKKEVFPYHAYQAWDVKNKDCIETYRFMRTIKPFNWGEIL